MNTKLGFAMGFGLTILAGAALAESAGQMMQTYDRDGDGTISVKEVVNVRTFTFNEVDADFDKSIDREEILAAVKARKLPRVARRDEGFMMENDLNRDGILTLEEYTNVSTLFKTVDANKDGLLQVEELEASASKLRNSDLL